MSLQSSIPEFQSSDVTVSVSVRRVFSTSGDTVSFFRAAIFLSLPIPPYFSRALSLSLSVVPLSPCSGLSVVLGHVRVAWRDVCDYLNVALACLGFRLG